jgi:glycine C-acetyltransferase
VIDFISQNTELIEKLRKNTELFRQQMTCIGFKINGDMHPICPVMLGDAKLANIFAEKMLGKYIFFIQ